NKWWRIPLSACVTADEYTAQPCPPAAWGGHDGHGEIGDDGIVGSWSGRDLVITDPTRSRLLRSSVRHTPAHRELSNTLSQCVDLQRIWWHQLLSAVCMGQL